MNSGSEANDLAMLMARMYTGRFDVISLRYVFVLLLAIGHLVSYSIVCPFMKILFVIFANIYKIDINSP